MTLLLQIKVTICSPVSAQELLSVLLLNGCIGQRGVGSTSGLFAFHFKLVVDAGEVTHLLIVVVVLRHISLLILSIFK